MKRGFALQGIPFLFRQPALWFGLPFCRSENMTGPLRWPKGRFAVQPAGRRKQLGCTVAEIVSDAPFHRTARQAACNRLCAAEVWGAGCLKLITRTPKTRFPIGRRVFIDKLPQRRHDDRITKFSGSHRTRQLRLFYACLSGSHSLYGGSREPNTIPARGIRSAD